jgi:heme/copper-type cytochrome/quinol oxidase subunit 3
MQQNLTEHYLTREELIALKNKRLGMTIFQISWIMAFICLVIVNLQLRGSYTSWPPPGVEKLGIVLPTLATAGLGVSVFLARRGLQMLRRLDGSAGARRALYSYHDL